MEDRLTYLERSLSNVDTQIRTLLLTRLELSYRLSCERAAQGRCVWDAAQDNELLVAMTAGLPRAQAEMMHQIWSIILREERKQYFLSLDRRAHS